MDLINFYFTGVSISILICTIKFETKPSSSFILKELNLEFEFNNIVKKRFFSFNSLLSCVFSWIFVLLFIWCLFFNIYESVLMPDTLKEAWWKIRKANNKRELIQQAIKINSFQSEKNLLEKLNINLHQNFQLESFNSTTVHIYFDGKMLEISSNEPPSFRSFQYEIKKHSNNQIYWKWISVHDISENPKNPLDDFINYQSSLSDKMLRFKMNEEDFKIRVEEITAQMNWHLISNSEIREYLEKNWIEMPV